MLNHYEILGVSPSATKQEIVKAYVNLSQKVPPAERSEMKKAYLILTESATRIQYDHELASQKTVWSEHSATPTATPETSPQVRLDVATLASKNYYERLGIKKSADSPAIRKAYAQSARLYSNETHPEHFVLIREAYETLYDKDSRKVYDESLSERPTGNSRPQNTSSPNRSSNPQSSPAPAPTPSPSPHRVGSSDAQIGWGFAIALIGSFIFTPVIAIPLGILVGYGVERTLSMIGSIIAGAGCLAIIAFVIFMLIVLNL